MNKIINDISELEKLIKNGLIKELLFMNEYFDTLFHSSSIEYHHVRKTNNNPQVILLLPGFLCTPFYLKTLKYFLCKDGNHVYDWLCDMNLGPTPDVLDNIDKQINQLYYNHNKKITIIGHSLGGLYARYFANRYPDKIKHIICAGSPHRTNPKTSNLKYVFEKVTGLDINLLYEEYYPMVREVPKIKVTNIFSKSDGIVKWYDCKDQISSSNINNIEIECTHLGMMTNKNCIVNILIDIRNKG